MLFHTATHDACGYLNEYHQIGPGYNYLGTMLTVFPTCIPQSGRLAALMFWKRLINEPDTPFEYWQICFCIHSTNKSHNWYQLTVGTFGRRKISVSNSYARQLAPFGWFNERGVGGGGWRRNLKGLKAVLSRSLPDLFMTLTPHNITNQRQVQNTGNRSLFYQYRKYPKVKAKVKFLGLRLAFMNV